jgi:arsenate reductase
MFQLESCAGKGLRRHAVACGGSSQGERNPLAGALRPRYRESVPNRKISVLFVSRRGTARGAMAAACLRSLDGERFDAFSCGRPGEVGTELHPLTIETLRRSHIPCVPSLPRSWDDFRRPNAHAMDFVITLDAAVAAQQPSWPGQPELATWGYPDVVAADQLFLPQPQQFQHVLLSLRRRLELLVALSRRDIPRADLRSDLRDMAFMA